MTTNAAQSAIKLEILAGSLGFELSGWTKAEAPAAFPAFERWIDAGKNAGMNYLARRCKERQHPSSVLPEVKSILALGVSYRTVLEGTESGGKHPIRSLSGIAEYARGTDYHLWCSDRLRSLSKTHAELFPAERCRGVVDTAPLLERQFAVNTGLGFIGRNTMLINETLGSKFFLAFLLSTAELPDDVFGKPIENSCDEDCRLCIEHCPVGALTDYVLDARRCLNYWTIEYNGSEDDQPQFVKDKIAERPAERPTEYFFGCDVCQNVCPKNLHIVPVSGGTIPPESLSPEELRRIAADTPLERGLIQVFQ
ncbi:MAG: DUF1730 domain-containing protein [Planctomycetaceae bacterium]|nr:DUF1730 domain-containing protein [Planctomycetaceae bacterium]